ncbi:hypothetical protein [Pasteuria penetrans]|uniref:hypothetical protein n=1 Tax=Pasteuria penetrans TaxID=86005 RepID=UPI001CAA69A3|nr:hypothetical protein [Pasteuria penetrans]
MGKIKMEIVATAGMGTIGTQQVPSGNAIPLTVNFTPSNSFFFHVPGSTQITVAPNEIYWINYNLSAGGRCQDLISILRLNGFFLLGSESSSDLLSLNQLQGHIVLHGGCIVHTNKNASVLELVVFDASSGDHVGTKNVNIRIFKLS